MDRNLTKDVKAYGLESILARHERVLCVVVRDVVLYYASSGEDEEQLIKRVVLELGLGSNLQYNKKNYERRKYYGSVVCLIKILNIKQTIWKRK